MRGHCMVLFLIGVFLIGPSESMHATASVFRKACARISTLLSSPLRTGEVFWRKSTSTVRNAKVSTTQVVD